jgi:hypothetical protein
MGGRGVSSLPEDVKKLEAVRRVTDALRTSAVLMHIVQTDSTVAVTYADSARLVLSTDGKESTVAWPGVGDVEAKAHWGENGLVVERKLEGGIKVVETYIRAPDSPRLIVNTEMKGTLRTMKFLRVYDGTAQP